MVSTVAATEEKQRPHIDTSNLVAQTAGRRNTDRSGNNTNRSNSPEVNKQFSATQSPDGHQFIGYQDSINARTHELDFMAGEQSNWLEIKP